MFVGDRRASGCVIDQKPDIFGSSGALLFFVCRTLGEARPSVGECRSRRCPAPVEPLFVHIHSRRAALFGGAAGVSLRCPLPDPFQTALGPEEEAVQHTPTFAIGGGTPVDVVAFFPILVLISGCEALVFFVAWLSLALQSASTYDFVYHRRCSRKRHPS